MSIRFDRITPKADVRKVFEVTQDTSGQYNAVIYDSTGALLPGSSIESATLTLVDSYDNAIINSRDAQDVLQTNQVTFDESGLLTWSYLAADMPRIHATRTYETHIAQWTITSSSGTAVIIHEVVFRIVPITTL